MVNPQKLRTGGVFRTITPHEDAPPPIGVTTTDRPKTLSVPSNKTLSSCSINKASPSEFAVILAPLSDCKLRKYIEKYDVRKDYL